MAEAVALAGQPAAQLGARSPSKRPCSSCSTPRARDACCRGIFCVLVCFAFVGPPPAAKLKLTQYRAWRWAINVLDTSSHALRWASRVLRTSSHALTPLGRACAPSSEELDTPSQHDR